MRKAAFTVPHVCRQCGELKPITAGRARQSDWSCGDCYRRFPATCVDCGKTWNATGRKP